MPKFLNGFTERDVFIDGAVALMGICACCGADAVSEKAQHAYKSILVFEGIGEEKARKTLDKDMCGTRQFTYFSVPLPDGETMDFLLNVASTQKV